MTIWISQQFLLTMHNEQLADYGGAIGVRNAGLLESTFARQAHRTGIGKADIVELGALYAIAITRNRPFIDGNKRAGFMAMVWFLAANGSPLEATEAEAVVHTLAMASGELTDAEFTQWVREHA